MDAKPDTSTAPKWLVRMWARRDPSRAIFTCSYDGKFIGYAVTVMAAARLIAAYKLAIGVV